MDYTNFDELIANYKDTEEVHRDIWIQFKQKVNATYYLKNHRDYIVRTRRGYGNRSLHYLWELLVEQMPVQFKFLEIGVYMGQVISLVQLISNELKKEPHIYGVTPLSNDGDKYSKHPDVDYRQIIAEVYAEFGLKLDRTHIIEGLSTQMNIMIFVKGISMPEGFDIVFIDGGHDYETVESDLKWYAPLVKVGGFLVMDDASNYLKMPRGLIRMDWFGLPDVSNAVRDVIEPDDSFQHLFAVGHNRVWKRVK